MVNLSHMEQEFDAFFKGQPACCEMTQDWTYDKKLSFVLVVSASAWKTYCIKSGMDKKAEIIRTEAIVKDFIAKLNQRDYDSNTSLIHWKKASSLIRRLDAYNMSLDLFTKFQVGKALTPYKKHEDQDVKELAKTVLNKYAKMFKTRKEEVGKLKAEQEAKDLEELEELF